VKDIQGVEVEVGDEVAFNVPYYKVLVLGEVIRLTPKGVTVSYKFNTVSGRTSRKGHDVVMTEKGKYL
jgi:hypothetical protein